MSSSPKENYGHTFNIFTTVQNTSIMAYQSMNPAHQAHDVIGQTPP